MARIFWTTLGRWLVRESSPVRTAPTWKSRIPRVLGVLLLIGCGYAAYQAPRTSALQVQSVEVAGVRHLTEAQVRQVAGLKGTPFWRVNSAEVEARLEQLPYIASATVTAGWSSTAQVQLEERTAHVVWRNATGSYLVDAEGVVLEEAPEGVQLPVLEVEDDRALVPGQVLDARQLLFVLTLYSELPGSLQPGTARLKYDPVTGYSLVSKSGWTAIIGDASDIGVKAEVLHKVLKRGKVSFVDVSSPTTPYYRVGKR